MTVKHSKLQAKSRPSGNPAPERNKAIGTAHRWLISIVLALHFLLVALAMSANLSSSDGQRWLLGLFDPYLRTFFWRMELVPVELTHANEVEGPFRLGLHAKSNPDLDWKEYPGSSATITVRRRVNEIAKQIAYAAENENDEFVTELLTSFLKNLRSVHSISPIGFEADQVRIVRRYILARDEYRAVRDGLVERPESFVHFQAQIVWLGDDEVLLVPIVEAGRRSRSVESKIRDSTE